MNRSIQNLTGITNQLIIHLNRIPLNSYQEKLTFLGGATIGEHVRHIYNFPECLLKGIETGTVNYDKRTRNVKMEHNREYAVESLREQASCILDLEQYKHLPLLLETSNGVENSSTMATNLMRELHYIIEHTIHHTAILKLGFSFHFPEMEIDKSFGFAFSTLEYRKTTLNLNVSK